MEQSLQRRPGTPNVRVLDLGWQGLLNPNPINREEYDTLVDEYLSPTRLKALTGEDNLRDVTTLQMCVDTRERTLGNFGTHMPNLRELKLNNSVIVSIRDLGTSLSHLQVLWMACCNLTDLDGISSLSSLKELYLAYNALSDLSQVSMLENLEILDLEGNNLENVSELQYLTLCSQLTTLIVEGNPICARPSPEDTESSDYNYRVVVRKMIPQLQYLDDVPTDQINTNTPRTPNQDWLTVLDSIKENAMSFASVESGSSQKKKSVRPSTAQPVLTRRPHSAPRPSSVGRIVQPSKTSHPSGSPLVPSEDSPVEDDTSDLTHGLSKVICGNPVKALRARKEKMEATFLSEPPKGFKPEASYDSVTVSQKDRDDVFAELKAWRESHHEVLQRLRDEKGPQVLTITHSDEEDRDSLCSSSEDEDLEDTWDSACLVRVSPEAAIHSPRSASAISLNIAEMSSLDSPRQPSPPATPCPPGLISVNSRVNKGADIRARRLHRVFTPSKTTAMATNACMGDEAFLAADFDEHVIRTQSASHPSSIQVGDLNRRSFSGPGLLEHTNSSRPTVARIISSHQPVIRSSIKTPERPSPPHTIRPATAMGVLQRLPNRPVLMPASKTSST